MPATIAPATPPDPNPWEETLRAAVEASNPVLAVQPHYIDGSHTTTGLRFQHATPHTGHTRTSGTLIITPDGRITLRAYTIPAHRWHTTLNSLGTLTPTPHHATHTTSGTPSWSLHTRRGGRSFSGILHPAPDLEATTLTGAPDSNGNVHAMLIVTPHHPDACHTAWATGLLAFHAMATGKHPQH